MDEFQNRVSGFNNVQLLRTDFSEAIFFQDIFPYKQKSHIPFLRVCSFKQLCFTVILWAINEIYWFFYGKLKTGYEIFVQILQTTR